LNALHKHDVPLLIFSAGISQIIEEVIKLKSTMTPNMHVVSNEITFDDGVSDSIVLLFLLYMRKRGKGLLKSKNNSTYLINHDLLFQTLYNADLQICL